MKYLQSANIKDTFTKMNNMKEPILFSEMKKKRR